MALQQTLQKHAQKHAQEWLTKHLRNSFPGASAANPSGDTATTSSGQFQRSCQTFTKTIAVTINWIIVRNDDSMLSIMLLFFLRWRNKSRP